MNLFRGKHSNLTLYSQNLFLNEGKEKKEERKKIRKENIEY